MSKRRVYILMKLVKRMDYEKAHEYLTAVKKVFDEGGISFFLIFGTLLGAVREKDFIAHDSDVDIGIFGKDIDRVMALVPKFRELGYDVCVGGNLISSGKRKNFYIFKKGSPMKVDIWIFFLYRGVRWFVRWMKSPQGYMSEYAVPIHGKFFKKLEKIDFRGQEFLTPHPAKDLLYCLWGEGWKIPNHGGVRALGVWFYPGELKDEENPNV